MKRNTHVFIPQQDFRYLSGEDNLGCYQVCCACCVHILLLLPQSCDFPMLLLLPKWYHVQLLLLLPQLKHMLLRHTLVGRGLVGGSNIGSPASCCAMGHLSWQHVKQCHGGMLLSSE